jgi:hypothetical protein
MVRIKCWFCYVLPWYRIIIRPGSIKDIALCINLYMAAERRIAVNNDLFAHYTVCGLLATAKADVRKLGDTSLVLMCTADESSIFKLINITHVLLQRDRRYYLLHIVQQIFFFSSCSHF